MKSAKTTHHNRHSIDTWCLPERNRGNPWRRKNDSKGPTWISVMLQALLFCGQKDNGCETWSLVYFREATRDEDDATRLRTSSWPMQKRKGGNRRGGISREQMIYERKGYETRELRIMEPCTNAERMEDVCRGRRLEWIWKKKEKKKNMFRRSMKKMQGIKASIVTSITKFFIRERFASSSSAAKQ